MTIEQQIIQTLDKVRPFLQRDGGDLVFDSFKDGVVYVKMQGACVDCMLLDTTITDGVEMILIEEVPGVQKVEVLTE